MKKQMIRLILVICLSLQFTVPVSAHRKNLSAFTKESIPCYSDSYGSERIDSVPKYTGMDVKDETGSYYLVEYEKKKDTKTGWVAKSDVKDQCLKYDGSEIAVVASGTYLLGGQKIKVTFLGDQKYKIRLERTKEYFTGSAYKHIPGFSLTKDDCGDRQIWEFKRVKNQLLIQNKKNQLYLVPCGKILQMGSYKKAMRYSWQLTRVDKNVDPYYNVCQYDGRWGGKKYGSSTTMAEAACGVLVVVNALYALNGQFMDPMDGAAYACDTGYRVPYSGTDEGFLTAVAKGLGRQYGFCYAGKANTTAAILKCLEDGGVVAAHVPGHYVAIVDYDKKTKKYLVLDSHPLAKRATSPFGTWVKKERLEAGGLNAYSNFMYKQKKNTKFMWNLDSQGLSVMQGLALDLDPEGQVWNTAERNENGKVE